jgi:ABC-2 type transport system permease protein
MSQLRSLTIARNEVRVLRRDPTPLMILLVMPLIFVPIFRSTYRAVLVLAGVHGASGAEFAVPGAAVQFLFFLAPTVGFAFFREHAWGTWDRLRASTATNAEILTGKSLPMLALGAAQLLLVFGVGVFALDLHVPGSVAGVVVVSAALLVCVVTFGLAITAIAHTMQQVSALGYLGATLCNAIGGALVPFATLPAWLRAIAPITPQYWAMRAYNALILRGAGFSASLLPVAMLLGYAAVFVAVTLVRFRFDDAKVAWA